MTQKQKPSRLSWPTSWGRLTRRANVHVVSTFFLRHNSFLLTKIPLTKWRLVCYDIERGPLYGETSIDLGCWSKLISCKKKGKNIKDKKRKNENDCYIIHWDIQMSLDKIDNETENQDQNFWKLFLREAVLQVRWLCLR